MSAVIHVFFAPVRRTDTAWAIIGWWESRRWLYNASVGVAGLVAAIYGFGALPPHPAVVGPTLFRYGFVFAVGLTLLPVVPAVGSWVVRILIARHGI